MGDDELDEAIKSCQAWAERLLVLFPDKNLTRKGHSLSVHIPETLRSCRTYYMFYELEYVLIIQYNPILSVCRVICNGVA